MDMDNAHHQKLLEELRCILNKVSAENDSDTPDFILSEYMLGCLDAYSIAVTKRDKWFDVNMWGNKNSSLLNSEQGVQVSDTTEDDSSTGAGNQKKCWWLCNMFRVE